MSNKRVFLKSSLAASLAFAGLVLAAGPALAAADDYPNKPIRLIVPFPPGGPTDVMGRVIGKALGEKLGQTVVVENKPGAGGNLGTDAVAKSPADGYTIALSAVSSLAIAPSLYKKLPYNVSKDLTPIARVGITKGAIVAHPSAPFNDLKGLVAYAKANPGKLSYGSSGIGTANHLAGEMLASVAGIDIVHIPYKGTAPLTQDLLGGQLPLSIESSLTAAGPNVKEGKLKAIAIISATRSPLLPNVPTVAEQGYPGFDVPIWFGLVGPAGLPKEVVAKLNQATVEALKSPEVIDRFAQIGAEPAPSTPQGFGDYIRSENERWGKVIRDAKITLE
ncbi:MAG TPA: tripartite tricarboxylate transporter substrate binding protein [Rubrivivax sp.]|nr:tripartite tricarboxylate transporter substrate binding protein [Rubrivivax sp.]